MDGVKKMKNSSFFSSNYHCSSPHYKVLNFQIDLQFLDSCNLLNYLLTYLPTYLRTYLLTYLFTPWSRVLLEKLTGSQLIKKFPAFYEARWFITAFTKAHHLSLS